MPQILQPLILTRIRQRHRIDSRLLQFLHQPHCCLALDAELLSGFPNRRIHTLAVADLAQQIRCPFLGLILPSLSRNTGDLILIPQMRTCVILIHAF